MRGEPTGAAAPVSFADRVVEAWKVKVDHSIEDCLVLTSALQQELGLTSSTINETYLERLTAKIGAVPLSDFLLLHASLARSLGTTEACKNQIAQAERVLVAAGVSGSFRLCFEQGLECYIPGDYGSALEKFLGASYHSRSDFEKVCALSNALFCMDNLGLPCEKTFVQIESLLQRLEETPGLEGVRAQIYGFQLREGFREARLGELLKKEQLRLSAVAENRMDQGKYFSLWFRQLPFHCFHRDYPASALETFSLCSRYFPYRNYRLHTLQGVLHPDDLKLTKISELIDRLYLWVWRWLESPERFPIQKIMVLLRDFPMFDQIHRLTAEDRQQLRNAMLWLGLFDPTSERQLRSMVGLLMGASRADFPLFGLEHLTIHYLLARRERNDLMAKDFRAALEAHPLWTSPDFYFRSLIESVEAAEGDVADVPASPPKLETLCRNLRAVLQPEEASLAFPVLVDMNSFQLIDRRNGQKIVSQPLCLALHLMRSTGTVSCDEFVHVAFNLRHYDTLIHNGKIFNLLSRMKALFPEELKFRMKSGFIIAEGSWAKLHFKVDPSVSTALRTQPEWRALVYSQPWTGQYAHGALASGQREARPAALGNLLRSSGPFPSRPDWEGALSRRDVERRLGKPRSTTNRILLNWVKNGLVIQEGKARATRYRIRNADGSPADLGPVDRLVSGS